jgi:hypothetical protein
LSHWTDSRRTTGKKRPPRTAVEATLRVASRCRAVEAKSSNSHGSHLPLAAIDASKAEAGGQSLWRERAAVAAYLAVQRAGEGRRSTGWSEFQPEKSAVKLEIQGI